MGSGSLSSIYGVAEVHYWSWSYILGALLIVGLVIGPIAYMFVR